MNQYEITHKGKRYVMMSIDSLMKTLIDFCTEENVNPNEIESCVLVHHIPKIKDMPKKEVKPIKGLSHTIIKEICIDQDSSNDLDHYTLKVDFMAMNKKGCKNISKFFEKLVAKHHSKQ